VIETIDRIGPDLTTQGGGLVRDPSQTPGSSPLAQPTSGAPPSTGGSSFRDALSAAADEHSLQFSEHAMKRVEQRQIPMQGDEMDRLSKAMDTLSQRGSRGQSLVMLDNYAYVVHAQSHTVVTAVEPNQDKERVFTKIDSVVIA
jgi:flagellar operon protein